jgi:hypothetical protein
MWRTTALTLALAFCSAGAVELGAGQAQDDAAIKQFDAAIAAYLALRQRLAEEVPGPTAESTATKLNQDSDALAAAIQRARAKAKPGDLFVLPAIPVIKQRVVDAVRRENLGPVLAGIDDEDSKPARPSIHMRFPAARPMATMPPSLLAVLPKLPSSLEYRIVGEFLILRDVEAALILDFIPAAIPR